MRDALRQLLAGVGSVTVVGECADAPSAVALVDRRRADLLITDVQMPPSGQAEGIRLAGRLRATHPQLGVVVLSAYADVAYALRLVEDGAEGRGYLLKERIGDRAEITAAVHTVASGGSVIDAKIVEELLRARATGGKPGHDAPTAVELRTLALVAEGRGDAAIGEALALTAPAARRHIDAIFAKLELGDARLSRRVGSALHYLADCEPSELASRAEAAARS